MRVTKKDCEELIVSLNWEDVLRLKGREVDIKENDARVGGYKVRVIKDNGGYTTMFSGTIREVYAWLSGISFTHSHGVRDAEVISG